MEFYAKIVSLGPVEPTGVTGKIQGLLASELTNFPALGSAQVGFDPRQCFRPPSHIMWQLSLIGGHATQLV